MGNNREMMVAFSTLILIGLVMVVVFGQRRRHWNEGRSMDRYPQAGPPPRDPRFRTPSERDLEGYVEGLETRIAQLEERLDFTERLLMDRPAVKEITERSGKPPAPAD